MSILLGVAGGSGSGKSTFASKLRERLKGRVCVVKMDNYYKCLDHLSVEERAKGYAANLIYAVTNDLLKQGLVPLLYTDYNYVPSNRAYINAGYEDTGILINFTCSKNKIKERRK